MSNRLEKLRNRKLFKWALAYGAAAWLVLQISDVLGNRWDWPQEIQRTLDILLVAGALVTVVLAWFHGEKGQQRVTGMEAGLLCGIVFLTGTALFVVGDSHEAAEGETPDQKPLSFPESSIAVLPCTNRTGNDELAYFVDGIHAELIDELANLGGLDVRARRSVLRYASSDVQLQQVAAALKVGSALACEVFSVGESVRIRAELLRLNPEDLLWSDAYDRGTEDVVALYRDVARSVAEEITVAISPAESLRLDDKPTVDPNAYQLYLSGRYLLALGTRAGRDQAVGNLATSISLGPDYAPAWAVLASAYLNYVTRHALLDTDVKELITAFIPQHAEIISTSFEISGPPLLAKLARDAAERAVTLDPDLAASWIALGRLHLDTTFDFAAAMAALDRALSLQPSNANARVWRAFLLRIQGQWSGSLQEYERAVLDDPLSLGPQVQVNIARFYAGEPDRAFQELEALIDSNPDKPDIMWFLALILADYGHYARSNEVLERQIPLMGEDTFADELALMGYNYGRQGLYDAARKVLDDLDTMERDGHFVSPIIRSFPLIGLGEYDAAFTWIDKALEKRDPWLNMLHLWPALAPVRGDPRFNSRVQRIGLPQVTYPCFNCE